MPWTNTDLATIDAAIATGASQVRFSDGKQVTYRSIDDLKKARTEIQLYISSMQTDPTRQLRIFTEKGW